MVTAVAPEVDGLRSWNSAECTLTGDFVTKVESPGAGGDLANDERASSSSFCNRVSSSSLSMSSRWYRYALSPPVPYSVHVHTSRTVIL